jgi:hypothetical protein
MYKKWLTIFKILHLYTIFMAKTCQTKKNQRSLPCLCPEIFCRKSTYFFKKWVILLAQMSLAGIVLVGWGSLLTTMTALSGRGNRNTLPHPSTGSCPHLMLPSAHIEITQISNAKHKLPNLNFKTYVGINFN